MRFKEVSWKRGISSVKCIHFTVFIHKVFGNTLAEVLAEAQGCKPGLENMIGAWKFESKMA